jgi:hypothetical protein
MVTPILATHTSAKQGRMRVFTIRGLAWAFLARSSSWSCLWWLGGVNVEGGFDVT